MGVRGMAMTSAKVTEHGLYHGIRAEMKGMVSVPEKSWRVSITAIVTVLVLALTVALGALQGARSDSGPAIGWGIAQLVETDDSGDDWYPEVSLDGSGNGVAVWQQHDGVRSNIWSNRYVVGMGWGTAELIETDDSGDALRPQVSVDSPGNAIAVWFQYDGVRYNIWSNRYVVGTGWGTAQLIETNDSGGAYGPHVSVDSSGNAIAVWSQWDGDHNSIWSNLYAVGTGWGTAELVETNNSGDAGYAQVSMDSAGNAIAVWSQWDGDRDNIWSNRFVVGTGWGTAQMIEISLGGAGPPQVSVNGSGSAIAVWYQHDGVRYSIWSNRYVVGMGWGTGELIETDDSGDAWYAEVALDSSGNGVAVWQQHDGVRTNIWSNRYSDVMGWGTGELIETNDSGDALYPQVSVDGSGNAIAVWWQSDGACDNIWSNRYVVGTGWGTAQLIETDDSGSAYSPQVSVDSSGNAIAVWNQYDGARNNIWSNRYESEGPVIPEFGAVIIPILSVAAIFFVMKAKKKEA